MAIAYDFDGTLAQGNIQENSFIPAIGMKKRHFGKKTKRGLRGTKQTRCFPT
jgi:hypothetical protein